MKILYYKWFENSELEMITALLKLGHQVVRCHIPIKDYENDEEFICNMGKILLEQEIDAVFSFDYFPVVAKAVERQRRKYISWTYDCPHWSLFSPSVKSPYNYIFLFDYQQYVRLLALELPHVFYFPLAADTQKLNEKLGVLPAEIAYQDEISFVGSLYENNLYRQINFLPEYLRGYLEGILESQKKIYGYNFLQELLTEEIRAELKKYVKMNLDTSYLAEEVELYADMLDRKSVV